MATPTTPDLTPGAAPQAAVPAQKAAAPAPPKDVPGPAAVPTGFPEPVTPDLPRSPAAPGMVRLATVPPMGSLTVPPLYEGGESVVITTFGTDVDEGTAARAREAAGLAGLRLVEL